ncbi:MAG: Gfo/Idh/MocA family oxidoreductase [Planctomycetes bacterium]|nr:Gfo/Idh/MocA family oxidoreductase [Planctomycetota bacterium]
MSNSELPRICIVGAGNLSTKRIYPNIGTAGGKLVGICDLDQDKAKKNSERWGGTVYSELEKMLDTEKPDGVIICIGPEMHAKLSKITIARGIPTYTEKPSAPDAASALEVAKLAKEKNVLCTTAFKKRYNVAYTRAKEFISKFPAEDLYGISIDYCSAQYAPHRSFIHDFCIHVIDLIGFLGGDIAQVFAFKKDADAYAVSLKFTNGGVGSLSLNDGRSFQIPTEEVEISLRGGNFMSIHNSSQWRIGEGGKCTEWREPPTFTSAGDSGYETGHLAEIEDFFAAIREGRTTRSNIYESYKSLVLFDAIVESAESGKVVDIVYETI